jgi:hypothetical protein
MRRRLIRAGHEPIIKLAGSGVSNEFVIRWISLRNIAAAARPVPAVCSPDN